MFDVCQNIEECKQKLKCSSKHQISEFYLTKNTAPVKIQLRGTCGLNAFAQIIHPFIPSNIQLYAEDCDSSPVSLLYIAKSMELTQNGEIYDPATLVKLGNELGLNINAQPETQIYDYQKTILDNIHKGKNVMVTMDEAGTGKPGFKQGLTSHWVVIIGYVKINGCIHTISVDGTPKVKIIQLSDLFRSTMQLIKTPNSVRFVTNNLKGAIVNFEKINKTAFRKQINLWEQKYSLDNSSNSNKENSDYPKILQQLTSFSFGNQVPNIFELLETAKTVPAQSKWYQDIQFEIGSIYHNVGKTKEAKPFLRNVKHDHPAYSKAQNYLSAGSMSFF